MLFRSKKTSWLFAALSIAALTFGASAALAAENVKIGVLMPLTGNAAAAGQASKAAIEVAAEIVNNAHPELGNLPLATTAGLPHLGGAKLDVVFVDHQGNPSLAQQLATRLVTEDKVNALMGAYQSSCTFTATPVAERYGIPFMVADSTALNITGRGFKYVFRATPIATDFARTYMRFFSDMKKEGKTVNSIAIINEIPTTALRSATRSRRRPRRTTCRWGSAFPTAPARPMSARRSCSLRTRSRMSRFSSAIRRIRSSTSRP